MFDLDKIEDKDRDNLIDKTKYFMMDYDLFLYIN